MLKILGFIVKSLFFNKIKLEKACATYDVISFDIFDTLIKRKCKTADGIFLIVEKKFNMISDIKITNFREIRTIAEKTARRECKNEEISLSDIYKYITALWGVNIAEQLFMIEIQTEIEQSVSNKEMVHLYNKCLLSGKIVLIISDMYLPKRIIVDILQKNDIKLPHKLYLSSEINKTKRSGSIYPYILSDNIINSDEILHIGDNLISDFFQSRKNGINSFII